MVFITIVYIAPGANANANEALQELHETITSLQIKHRRRFTWLREIFIT